MVAYIAIILSTATPDKTDGEYLKATAHYNLSTGFLAVNFNDISNNTQNGEVSMTKTNGEKWHVGSFTGSKHAFIMPNANETQSLPTTVTFELESRDGVKLVKTIDVQIEGDLETKGNTFG